MLRIDAWKKTAVVGTVAFSIALSIALPKRANEVNQAGREKAGACAACHGADGNSISPAFPRIAGQHANYLTVALQNYRSGSRQNPVMGGIAKSLKDQDIADLANYYANLPGLLSTLPRN